MAGNTIVVSVLADTANFKKGMDSLGDFGRKVGAAMAALAAAASVALGALAVKSVTAAGDLEQSIGAVDTVFKDSAKQMHAWGQSAAQDVGLARNEFNELGTLIGTQLKNGGTAMDELAPKTNNLIQLGADLSSMFGGTTREAVEALSSALKGERDPIEKYGVSLNQASIDAKAAELGFKKVDGALSAEASQAATLALIMEQTSDAHGNFAKEADELPGQLQRLTAEWENMQATIGTYLLPIVSEFVGFLNEQTGPALDAIKGVMETAVVPAFEQLAGFVKDDLMPALEGFGEWITENQEPLGVLAALVGGAAAAYAIWTGAITAWNAITTIATAIQAGFNAVLAANPIMLVVIAVAALVAGLVYFFTQTEVGRQAWSTFTGFLKSAWDAVVKFFSTTLENVKRWFKEAGDNVTRAWEGVSNWFSQLPGRIGAFFAGAASLLLGKGREILDGLKRGAEIGWAAVSSFMGSIPGRITSALGSAGTILLAAGRSVIDGFFNGLKASWGKVTDFVGGIASWIRNNKGPISKDRTLLIPAGNAIMGGFHDALAAGWSDVQDLVKGFAPELAGGFDVGLAVPPGGTVNVYHFNGVEVRSRRAEQLLEELADEIDHYAGVGV